MNCRNSRSRQRRPIWFLSCFGLLRLKRSRLASPKYELVVECDDRVRPGIYRCVKVLESSRFDLSFTSGIRAQTLTVDIDLNGLW